MDSSASSSSARAKHFLHIHNKVFTVQYLLGKGTFGHCYAYVHQRTGHRREQVAVKVMTRNSQHMQEMSVHAMQYHPHIVRIIHQMQSKNHFFLVMEKCQRTLLHVFHKEYPQQPWQTSRIRTVFKGVLSALVYLHARNYVHRDVKLPNLLIHSGGCVKLCDFVYAAKTDSPLYSFSGTANYMSPEVISRSLTRVHPCLDVWSFGCCVFMFLLGHHPFAQPQREATILRIQLGLYAQSPKVIGKTGCGAARLQRLLGRMFEDNYKERITATALMTDPFFAVDNAENGTDEIVSFPAVLHNWTSHTRTKCQLIIRNALKIQRYTRNCSSQTTSKQLQSRNQPLRWIIKHTVFAAKRFFYAMSDGSYAMLFDGDTTVLRSHGSSTNRLIHHNDINAVFGIRGIHDMLAVCIKQNTLDAFHDDKAKFFAATPTIAVPIDKRSPSVEYVTGYLCIPGAMIVLFSNSTVQIDLNERTFLIRDLKVGEVVDSQWIPAVDDLVTTEFKTLLKWLAERLFLHFVTFPIQIMNYSYNYTASLFV